MEINQLRFFLSVASNGSFSKAAERCFVSQSHLSELIQRLETELGKTLFDRTHRKVVPTEAGKLLIGRAKRILTQIEMAKREVRNSDGINGGKVTFGILPTIAPYFLPHVLKTFQERCPKIQFVIYEGMTFQLTELIEENKLDFGIMSLPVKEHGFETEELFVEELLLAMHPKSPLTKREKIWMKDLHGENFILLHEGHCLGDQVLDFCNRHDFCPRIALRSGQVATIQSLVRAEVGISLIPQMAAQANESEISYRSLEKPQPKRSIAVVMREKRPLKKPAQEFLKHLRHAGKTFTPPAPVQI